MSERDVETGNGGVVRRAPGRASGERYEDRHVPLDSASERPQAT